MKKLLFIAGLFTAVLFGYKIYDGGSLSLPSSLSSLLPLTKSPALSKGKPSHRSAAPRVDAAPVEEQSVAPVGDSAASGATTLEEAILGAKLPVFADEDVHARIAFAIEFSRALTDGQMAPMANSSAGSNAAKFTGNAPYEGVWTGKFFGLDAGTVFVKVGQNGLAFGQGVSVLTGISFALVGKVQNNGLIWLAPADASLLTTGAAFNGRLTRDGRGSGGWEMATYNVSGTWQLALAAPVQ
jgi:hypothetical protein